MQRTWKTTTRGDLKRKVQQKSILVDALNAADSQDFRDVQVITLKQKVLDQARESAWESCSDIKESECRAQQLFCEQITQAKEFVWVDDSFIQVGVDADIIDDNAVDRAVMLLMELGDFNQNGYYEF